MKQFNVTGMSCAACSARVEKAVQSLGGVEKCSVNLLTGTMGVEGTAEESAIIDAVVKAGYGATASGTDKGTREKESLKDKETPALIKRLIISAGFLIVLMYFSMGHNMFSLPLPPFFQGNYIAIGIVQLLLCVCVMIINGKFFISGIKGVINKAPNMDTLVAMGSGASFLWSVYILLRMTAYVSSGNLEAMAHLSHEFYFESAAMILTLITVGKTLEAKSKGKTTSALKALMNLRPEKARVIKDGEEIITDIDLVKKGDVFVLHPGESVPADALVIKGHSAVNEASLTGESIPVEKKPGDRVSAATVNQSGVLYCEAVAVGEDTTLSQIIKMVSDAAATKAPIAKIADKVSGIFVPVVIAIALVTALVWALSGQSAAFVLERAISVLVISCPCALGLATPVAIMVGNGVGAKNGILFKSAPAMEKAGKIQIVALDKTGTITKGEPEVTDVVSSEGTDEGTLLEVALSLEKNSEHPLAAAVVSYAEKNNISSCEISGFSAVPGSGVRGILGGKEVFGGNQAFIAEVCKLEEKDKELCRKMSLQGKTPLLFAEENRLIGMIFVADVIRQDSAEAIRELKNMGVHVVMLTGDNENTARVIGEKAGVDEIIAGVLPQGKQQAVKSLQKRGVVAMVGDGINDAPALTAADIGIAIGGGTDIAIDAGDIVLMKSRLSDVPALLKLSRKTLGVIHQNLFWAFFYNALGIPLAAGLWIPIFGWTLNPMFGAAAMSLSSFCVVSNALRLNLADIRKPHRGKSSVKPLAKAEQESPSGQLTIKVEGMMCQHCEKRVKECLEALSEIEEAEADYTKGTVALKLRGTADMKKIKKAIASAGYKLK